MAVNRALRAVGGRRIPPWVWWVLSAKAIAITLLVVLIGIAVLGMFSASGPMLKRRPATATVASSGATGDGTWDPGNIIADSVFYNSAAMTAGQIQAFLDKQGCPGPCLANGAYAWPATSVAWCQPVAAGTGSFAVMLATISMACGINPQVSLVMIQKESQGLTRPPPDALTGFGCPDTGAGGSANCDSGSSGVWAQTWGMVQAFAHLKADPSRDNYPPGKVSQILWNVAETGCGSGPVTVANVATSTLYTYTPYQPNAASLAAYPGGGDTCSSYGNRNFYRMFTTYFGSTGGGKPVTADVVNVAMNGVAVTLPPAAGVAGTVMAPNTTAAKAIAAGLSQLGVTYAWGGGDAHGPTQGIHDGGVADSFGDYNKIGFDCSGLILYAYAQAGINAPRDSQTQAHSGIQVPWAQHLPGDLVGYPGHIVMLLGQINGQEYQLESPESGGHVQVSPVRSDHYPMVARIWQAVA